MPSFGFRTKWGLVLLLFCATVLNYLDRQTLSVLAPSLQQEMELDNADLGWLFAIFYYLYTLSHFAVGLVLDRFNLRWCLAIAVIGWSVVTVVTGLATGFASLLVFRLLLGVAESANWPAALRILARTLPPEERALGNGIFTSGAAVGALIAPGMIFVLLAFLGWRPVFFILGFLGLLWAPIWLFFTRSPQLRGVWIGTLTEGGGTKGLLGVYRGFIRSRQFWWVLVVAVTVNPCFYYSVNWLPTYFVQVRGLVPGLNLGGILTIIYLSLDIGNIGGGASTLWLTGRNFSVEAARRIVFLSASGLVAACALVPFVTTTTSAVAALVAVNLGLGMWTSMYLTMAQEVSSRHVSTAAGTLSGFGSLAGAVAMWAVGRVTEQTGSFTIPMLSVSIALWLAAIAGWAASRRPDGDLLRETGKQE
jgi:ACS family hexuronate transporter-like MFS transporter